MANNIIPFPTPEEPNKDIKRVTHTQPYHLADLLDQESEAAKSHDTSQLPTSPVLQELLRQLNQKLQDEVEPPTN